MDLALNNLQSRYGIKPKQTNKQTYNNKISIRFIWYKWIFTLTKEIFSNILTYWVKIQFDKFKYIFIMDDYYNLHG